jgi:hypothetical protein
VARAQQSAIPVVGFLGAGSLEAQGSFAAGFRKGLSKPVMLKAAMWRSNFAGQRANTIDFRPWRPIWFADGRS